MVRTYYKTYLFFLFIFPFFAGDVFAQDSEFQTAEEILAAAHNDQPTTCASEIFLNALYEHANEISEDEDESHVRLWAHNIMSESTVLEQVLKCPELKVSDYTTIHFSPIVFEFPNSNRTITISYSTQPKVLKQKLILAGKKSLPNGNPNPKLMDENDPAIYINTDPAWYAIMVVQHDSLSNFVGPEKNNTLSMKYLNDNIDSIYPHGYHCTSKSAIANDSDTINQVVREVVDIENDSNDYYVAGDVNLEWVMYAEIALEVAITVATAGMGEAAMIGLKGARATRTSKNLIKSMKNLSKLDTVKTYRTVAKQIAGHTDDIAKLEKNIKNAEKYEQALKRAEKARKSGKDATKYEQEAKQILENAKQIDPNMTDDALKNADKLKARKKQLSDEIKDLENQAEQMVKESKDVAEFKKQAETFNDIWKYRNKLRAFRRPQTGNVITRNLTKIKNAGKTIKAANSGAKMMTKAGRLARKGMSSRSAKIGNWLFDTTLKHGARLGRVVRDTGLIYGAITFLGDMYDQTSDSTNEFSNGIEFKPLCLLSADDLKGQENVVNYGMWLLWEGNSTDPADDDAAYLQAVDFASKFYYQLDEFQDEHSAQCNVDIYVVRPIIRIDESDPNKTKGELFYLFMNDVPWSTSEQFSAQISDISDWERTQKILEETDPDEKYTKTEKESNDESENE